VGFGAGLYFGIQNQGLILARSVLNSEKINPALTATIGSGSRIIG
jgi:hypothetical protein